MSQPQDRRIDVDRARALKHSGLRWARVAEVLSQGEAVPYQTLSVSSAVYRDDAARRSKP